MTANQTNGERIAVIIEDDLDIRQLLVEVLEQGGFETHSAGNGLDGIELVRRYEPIVTTLDVSMPGIDGFEAARRIREFSGTYLIMLTALGEEADTLIGLQSGADDYLVKPFRPRELRARIDAMLRRRERERGTDAATESGRPPGTATTGTGTADASNGTAALSPALVGGPTGVRARTPGADAAASPAEASAASAPSPAATEAAAVPEPATAPAPLAGAGDGDGDGGGQDGWYEHRGLRLQPEMHLASLHGDQLELTRSEFELLRLLMDSGRRVRSKADLALSLRGESYVTSYYVSDADKRAIEVHLANLRRKLGESATQPNWIETVRGVGYRMTAED
ncbi:response regulator transcription factor [Agromyces mediolanus]|uniref:response regulator transcription factor n=1 Tax=Agromyces mediolanus TaxID=41986 RepID=UPI00203C9A75|nr:response regulator transcription factor [Agromyces mediolanus]MCM3655942.1 response regulator transcription factor [Agromyces mediolanus]